jgi:hypothetical protein
MLTGLLPDVQVCEVRREWLNFYRDGCEHSDVEFVAQVGNSHGKMTSFVNQPSAWLGM